MSSIAWADAEAVAEEVEAMEAMYPDEIRLDRWPPILSLIFEGWEAEVTLTSAYPAELPTLRILPPPGLCTETEASAIASAALERMVAGEALLAELAQALSEQISDAHAVLSSARSEEVAEQQALEAEQQARLRELQDRQMAQELERKERQHVERVVAALDSQDPGSLEEEPQAVRFDFWNVGIHTGEPITDRKSTFLAFAWAVTSREDVDRGLYVLRSNNKIARAAHNMLAWRFVSPATGNLVSECDSDGESGAGGGLHSLLHNTGAENVAVLVSRWYGGIHLGPDRFKHTYNTARALLAREGFIPGGKKKTKRK